MFCFVAWEWGFKEIVSHQQSVIAALKEDLAKKRSVAPQQGTLPATVTQSASPGAVNAVNSEVKTGDVGCPALTSNK
jgi:hypothetical protein